MIPIKLEKEIVDKDIGTIGQLGFKKFQIILLVSINYSIRP